MATSIGYGKSQNEPLDWNDDSSVAYQSHKVPHNAWMHLRCLAAARFPLVVGVPRHIVPWPAVRDVLVDVEDVVNVRPVSFKIVPKAI